MAEYRVRYKVLPAGTGPDDYESKDLEGGELVLELSDPVPSDSGHLFGGKPLSYGPDVREVEKAVIEAVPLKGGDQPIILTWDLVSAGDAEA